MEFIQNINFLLVRKIAITLAFAIIIAILYLQSKARFSLYFQKTEKNKDIINKCPSIKKVLI